MALEGIRVLDLTQWIFGPTCTAVLADWGADVIHIEDPEGGDPMRGMQKLSAMRIEAVNYLFELDNRNKRSLAIDITKTRGQEILHQLVQKSDVFVSTLRKNVLQRVRMDYDTLSRLNSRLIYAHISGYGERGPDSTRAGYDFGAFWARSGIMCSLGEPGSPPPPQRNGWGDHISALCLAGGISTALFARERTGIGQEVNLSLLGTAMWMAGINIQGALTMNFGFPQESRKTAVNPLFNSYKCKDEKWVMLTCLQPDRYWPGFCKAIDKLELEHDPRFDSLQKRNEDNVTLISIIDKELATRTRDEWSKRFDDNNVLWAPVQNFLEVTTDPQALANEYITEINHPTHGKMKMLASPIQFSRTPATIRTAAPEMGQHTEEILLENGYTWEYIAQLKNEGVII